MMTTDSVGNASNANSRFDIRLLSQKHDTKVDKFYVFFLTAMHIGAISALFMFSWTNLLVALTLYFLSGFGMTIGYHRLLTHQSFKTPVWIERFFAFLGTLCLEGGPITWVAQHRQHHAESDSEYDPHNIKVSFWHAHMGWIFLRYPSWYEAGQRRTFAPDLEKVPFYRLLEKYSYLPSVVLSLILLATGGLDLFLWGMVLRIVCVYHFTWFVNSACHKWGYRHFGSEVATNNWWVALLSFGEGWHNNHHAFPSSARHGLRFWEFDSAWVIIWTLSKLGLVKKIKIPNPTELPWKKLTPSPAQSV